MQVKVPEVIQPQTSACHHWRCPDDTTDDNKNNHSLRWPSVKMEHKRDCETIGEIYENSKLADSPLNADNVWQKVAVRVTKTMKSQYLIRRNTQIVELSGVTREQSKHIKTVDMAILKMIPQCDPDLTAYLNELLRTKKPEQQSNISWFPTLENPGKPQDHTPIQTRILKEFIERKKKETLNPQENTESRKKNCQTIWLNWHTSNRNRESSNWIYPGWLSWRFRQTQHGYWDEHGIQGETNSKRHQKCIQSMSTNADPL